MQDLMAMAAIAGCPQSLHSTYNLAMIASATTIAATYTTSYAACQPTNKLSIMFKLISWLIQVRLYLFGAALLEYCSYDTVT